MESPWVHYVYSMCILSSLCVLDLLAIYFVSDVYLLCLWCVFYHMCVTCVFYLVFFCVLGILCLRFSWCLLLDMSHLCLVSSMCMYQLFLWVLCPTFCFSCVMRLMSSMFSGSNVQAMGFQYFVCLVFLFVLCILCGKRSLCVFPVS